MPYTLGCPLAAASTKLGKAQMKAMQVDIMIRAGLKLSESAHKQNSVYAVCNCYPSQVSSPLLLLSKFLLQNICRIPSFLLEFAEKERNLWTVHKLTSTHTSHLFIKI